jgi:Na+-transporting methylmalonyl-CoA/oxaloacetate decarboxylase beta subunit
LWLLEIAISIEGAALVVMSSLVIIIDVDKQKINCSEGSQGVSALPFDKCRVVER